MAGTKRLLKRTTTMVPKPLPARGKEEEPETVLCKGPDIAKIDNDEPMLGRCLKCSNPANSEVDRLCLTCHKRSAGYEFDEEVNRYVKIKGRK